MFRTPLRRRPPVSRLDQLFKGCPDASGRSDRGLGRRSESREAVVLAGPG